MLVPLPHVRRVVRLLSAAFGRKTPILGSHSETPAAAASHLSVRSQLSPIVVHGGIVRFLPPFPVPSLLLLPPFACLLLGGCKLCLAVPAAQPARLWLRVSECAWAATGPRRPTRSLCLLLLPRSLVRTGLFTSERTGIMFPCFRGKHDGYQSGEVKPLIIITVSLCWFVCAIETSTEISIFPPLSECSCASPSQIGKKERRSSLHLGPTQ